MTDQEQREKDLAKATDACWGGAFQVAFADGCAHGRRDSEGYQAGMREAAREARNYATRFLGRAEWSRETVMANFHELADELESLATTEADPSPGDRS